MRENRAMVKRLGLRKHSSSSFQTYPPLGAASAGIQLPIGQGTHIWGNVLRCYARREPVRADPLTVPPVKPRPFATNFFFSRLPLFFLLTLGYVLLKRGRLRCGGG
jgi:hypothetical protein